MAEKPDYYAVLGVTKTATKEEIEKAYKAFAFKNHPDRIRTAGGTDDAIKNAEVKFSLATEAKTVLVDPEKRRTYDSYGHDGLARMASGQSSGTGQSYTEAAGPVRVREKLTNDSLFDHFDKLADRQKREQANNNNGEPQISPEERRRRAAEERVKSRDARRSSGAAPPPSTSVTPATTAPKDQFRETAEKVGEAAERLQSGMASVPVDVLVKFRENLQDFIDQIDDAIETANKPKNGTRRP